MKIWKDFTFDAAHHLTGVPEGHKCGRVHGHTYRLRVFVVGPLDGVTGWIMDYADIAAKVAIVLDKIDHHDLNEIVENPTTERLVAYLWGKLTRSLNLDSIELSESAGSGCVYP